MRGVPTPPVAMHTVREHFLVGTVATLSVEDPVAHPLHRSVVQVPISLPPTRVTGAARCRRRRVQAHLRARSHDTVTRAPGVSVQWQRVYRVGAGGHRPRHQATVDATRAMGTMGNSWLSLPRMSKVRLHGGHLWRMH